MPTDVGVEAIPAGLGVGLEVTAGEGVVIEDLPTTRG